MALTLALLTTVPGEAQLTFTEIAGGAGLQFYQESELTVPIGAGAVWADFDQDGDDDVFIAQATGCNYLFLNNLGSFLPQVEALGLEACDDVSHGGGVADYDNDGDQDLYLSNNGQNRLFENRLVETGLLSFLEVTVAAGMDLDGAKNSSSAVWGDYDEDGYVDLFVGNHFTTMVPLVCNPDLLWHNNGDGSFTEMAADLGIARSGDADEFGCALAATWSDYDNDGDVDLMVVNDFGNWVPNRLFRNDGAAEGRGNWLFTDVSSESGFDYVMFGMGIATADIDRDGDLDYYMVDVGPNNLARNNGDGTFTDIAAEAGVEADDVDIYRGSGLVSWGPAFADADHDGWVDLFVANGGAPEEKFEDVFGEDYVDVNPNYCYHNLGDSTFTETHEAVGMLAETYNRAFTAVDFDMDGDLDLHVSNLEGFNSLYENQLQAGPNTHWIKIQPIGTRSNRDALGARVTATIANGAQTREVDGGSSFLSSSSRMVHFGLGSFDTLDLLEVVFLNGVRVEKRHLPVNDTYVIVEPTVLVKTSETDVVVAPGEKVSLSLTLENHGDELVERDFWLELRSAAGEQRVWRGPRTARLAPGSSFTHDVEVPLPAGAHSQIEMVFRVGDFATFTEERVVAHEAFVDVSIE